MNASRARAWICAMAVGLSATMVSAVNIETVPVGDPGNAPDTRYATPGYGGVSYTYNIGKYEVTAGQYAEFLNKVAGVDTYGLYNTNMADTTSGAGSGISRSGGGTAGDPYTYSVAADFVNRPVNYVSYWDACRFANWLHNGQPAGPQGAATTESGAYTLNGYTSHQGQAIQRNPGALWAVPTEDEWSKAAYYKGGSTSAGYWDFPTGSNDDPGRDLNDASGNNANYWGWFEDPYPIQYPYFTTVAGEFQNSASPYGTFDQGGNVWEWNETVVYVDTSYRGRGLRGGYFGSMYDGLWASRRASDYPDGDGSGHGFRVVEVPETASLAIVVLAGAGVLRRKKAW